MPTEDEMAISEQGKHLRRVRKGCWQAVRNDQWQSLDTMEMVTGQGHLHPNSPHILGTRIRSPLYMGMTNSMAAISLQVFIQGAPGCHPSVGGAVDMWATLRSHRVAYISTAPTATARTAGPVTLSFDWTRRSKLGRAQRSLVTLRPRSGQGRGNQQQPHFCQRIPNEQTNELCRQNSFVYSLLDSLTG